MRIFCKFRGDAEAVLEMPYKLMITVIVTALVLPVVLESASVLEDNNAELELRAQCELLADSVISVYNSGLGSVRLVSLDLPEDTAFLAAGASFEKGTRWDAISIRYKLIGGDIQKLTVRSGSVCISMCSGDMDAFKIHGEGEKKR